LLVVGILTIAGSGALAQPSGGIAGRVTDATSSQPVPVARLQLTQSGQIVTAGQDGRYAFRGLAAGSYEVRVIAVGYQSQKRTVTVAAGATETADFSLVAVPFTLEEIVTTAVGEQRRLELGTTVGTIRADSLTAFAPVTSMASLLQARSAGVTILPSAGTSGAGTRIRIRGANSPSLSNEPLLYVDGVKVNANAGSSSLATGGQAPSRLNDLNPDEIESIEIVKGPSAATLYGTEAANGVIRITTKRGKAGPASWSVYGEAGRLSDPNQYPDNFRSMGRTITAGVPGGAARTCLLTQIAAAVCTQDSLVSFNPLETAGVTPISTGHRQQVGASVSGGSDLAQYFIAGEYEGETGTFKLPLGEERRLLAARGITELPGTTHRPNALKKISTRANLSLHPASTVDINTSVGYVSSDTRLPQNDNNVLGMLPSGYFGLANVSDTAGNGGWGFFAPGEIFSLYRNQNVQRFTGSATNNWRPFSWLSSRATVGFDIGNRTDITFDPTGQGPAFGTTPLGTKIDNRTQLKTYTVDASATASFGITGSLRSRTTVGGQYVKDVFFQNLASGQRLAGGSNDIDGAGILTAGQTTVTTVKVGGLIEQQFNMKDRLFLTGAVRVDDNSAFGTDFNTVVFPKAGLSYIISDEEYFPKIGFLNLLRIRAAYGTSGRQPNAADALTFLAPTASAVAGTSTPAVTFGGLGLAGLKPERSSEIELGLDAQLFSDRLNLEVTYFSQKTNDALIGRILAPSLGASDVFTPNTRRIENLGRLSSRGIEVSINTRLIDGPSFGWEIMASGSALSNKLVELGEGIPPVINGIQRHTPGYPLGGFWERPITAFSDANGDGILELSEITIGDTAVFVGSPTPTREAALASTMSLFNGRVRLYGLLDYKGGHVQYNLTEVFRCTATGNNCRAMHDRTTPLDQQARAVARRFGPGNSNVGFIEDGEFLKLREVSITYTASSRIAGLFGARALTVTGAGRNLLTWSGYTGVDPEVNGLGQNAFNGFGVNDFLTQPPIRTFLLRVNLGF
jgi:TonB-linked SusC/RagA family outer membrane protein